MVLPFGSSIRKIESDDDEGQFMMISRAEVDEQSALKSLTRTSTDLRHLKRQNFHQIKRHSHRYAFTGKGLRLSGSHSELVEVIIEEKNARQRAVGQNSVTDRRFYLVAQILKNTSSCR